MAAPVKYVRLVAVGAVIFVALLVALGFVLPRRWHVERSVQVAAPPERIYPMVTNLRRWQEWSAWTRDVDPLARRSYQGPEEGVGAGAAWAGPTLGRGKLVIVSSVAEHGVKLDQAIEGEQLNSHASVRFERNGDGTKVTWTDEGSLPPVLGAYLRATVEERLGAGLEASLAKLKAKVEALPPAPAGTPDAGDVPLSQGGR